MTYFPKQQVYSSVTNIGLNTEFLWGPPAACTVQKVITAPGFKLMKMRKEEGSNQALLRSGSCLPQPVHICKTELYLPKGPI